MVVQALKTRRLMRRFGIMGAAAAIAIALGSFVIYSTDHKPIIAATSSPSGSLAAPSGAPSGSPAPSPVATSLAPVVDDTMTITIFRPIPASVSFPITCDSASFRLSSVTGTLYGEQVSANFADSTFELQRDGKAAYSAYVSNGQGNQPTEADLLAGLSLSLEGGDGTPVASGLPSVPFKGLGLTDFIRAYASVNCPWASAPTTEPVVGGGSYGSASLVLDAPAAATVTTPIYCFWSTKTTIDHYQLPEDVNLFGERVHLSAWESFDRLEIDRHIFANYTPRLATYQIEASAAGSGTVRFRNLTPDPESYPTGEPLPSPIDSFITPLGGNEAARSLSGTLTWTCGDPPDGTPDATPTAPPVQPAPSESPINWPQPVMTVKGRPGSWKGDNSSCGIGWRDPHGIAIGGMGQCGGPDWWVPTTVVQVKPGATLLINVPGFKLSPGMLAEASVAQVDYYRGGAPSPLATARPVASGNGLSIKAPASGDWVLDVQVKGKAADGSTINGTFYFHVRVVE
jgi:hypothetical protein